MPSKAQRRLNPNCIDEEIVSVDACRHVLITECRCDVPAPIRMDEGNDPPDFEMTINGHRHPVEVTSVAVTRSIEQFVHARRFAEALEKQAVKDGILSGTFVLTFNGTVSPPPLTSRDGRQLMRDALQFIEATSEVPYPEETELSSAHKGGVVSIAKLSSNGSCVGACITEEAQFESETLEELPGLLQERIESKLRALAKKNISAAQTLLLLYDSYGYASPDVYCEALNSVTGYSDFHSVFLTVSFTDRVNNLQPTQPGRDGIFLYSREAFWIGKGTVAFDE